MSQYGPTRHQDSESPLAEDVRPRAVGLLSLISDLDERLARLGEIVIQLDKHLDPVLLPPPGAQVDINSLRAAATGASSADWSAVAQRLHTAVSRIDQLTSQLAEIDSRAQL